MANGFPKPSRQPSFPPPPVVALAELTSPRVPSPPAPAEPNAAQPRRGGLRSLAPWCGLAAVAVAALPFIKLPREARHSAITPAERQPAAHQPGPLVAPGSGGRPAPRAQNSTIAAANPEAAPPPFVSNDPPRVPEPYTGDPEGQALWEKVVEEEQQTLQPDDLIEDTPPPRLDLTKIPAYQAQGIDADGNLN